MVALAAGRRAMKKPRSRGAFCLAYPFVGIGFILTMLAGAWWLDESLSAARIAGTLMIAAGCVLVARSA